MVPGVLVHVGASSSGDDRQRFLLVPSLTLSQLRTERDRIAPIKELMKTGSWLDLSDSELDRMAEVMLLAIGRNHPTLTADQLLDLLDIHSANAVLAVLLGNGKPVVPNAEEEKYLSDSGMLEINPLYSRPLQA